MRYYSVAIAGAPASFPVRYDGGAQWGTEVNGRHDPGAQQVEFQIEELRPDLPNSESTLTVQGVTFQQIKDTGFLIGKPIAVFGGMRPGLPIATAQAPKAGLLMQAQIIRAWGNWIGTEMSIGMTFAPAGMSSEQGGGGGGGGGGDGASQILGAVEGAIGGGGGGSAPAAARRFRNVGFRSINHRPFSRGAFTQPGGDIPVVSPFGLGDVGEFGGGAFGAATSSFGGITSSFFGGGLNGLQAPLNLIHNMQPNMLMSSAISQTLGVAFPRGGSNVQISSGLKLPYQDVGMYQNLQQYAGFIKQLSQSILGIKNYQGVNFSAHTNTLNVWDATKPIGEGQIAAIDLIGQPTWVNVNTINIKTVLRGDIHCGMFVTLPPTLLAIRPEAVVPGLPDQKMNTSFSGSFVVNRVLHIGDFRNPDGAGWSSNFECFFLGATQGQTDASETTDQSSQDQSAPSTVPGSGPTPILPPPQIPVAP